MDNTTKNKIIDALTNFLTEYVNGYEIDCASDDDATTFECEIAGNEFSCDIDVTIYGEYRDESFSHAFGVQVDPYRGWYATSADVTNVSNACLVDADGNEWAIDLRASDFVGHYV